MLEKARIEGEIKKMVALALKSERELKRHIKGQRREVAKDERELYRHALSLLEKYKIVKDEKLSNKISVKQQESFKKALQKFILKKILSNRFKDFVLDISPKILETTSQHFGLFVEESRLKKITKETQVRTLKKMGVHASIDKEKRHLYTKAGDYYINKRNKYWGGVLNVSGVVSTILNIVKKGVKNGIEIAGLKKDLRAVRTNKHKKGILSKKLDPQIGYILRDYRNIQQAAIAKAYGIKAFVYSGSIVDKTKTSKGSRPFCVGGLDGTAKVNFLDKRGRVFLEAEAELWDYKWRGKRNRKDYEGDIHLGDINCIHNASFIPMAYANVLREGLADFVKTNPTFRVGIKYTGYSASWHVFAAKNGFKIV